MKKGLEKNILVLLVVGVFVFVVIISLIIRAGQQPDIIRALAVVSRLAGTDGWTVGSGNRIGAPRRISGFNSGIRVGRVLRDDGGGAAKRSAGLTGGRTRGRSGRTG